MRLRNYCSGTTNSSVPSNAAHLPHRPSAFSISSSSDGSSGSSSTDSRDSTPMNSSHRNGNINEPSTSRGGGGGGVMVHKNPLLNVAASGGGGGGGHSHTPGSSSSVSLSSSSQSGHNMPSHDQPAAISRKKIISKSQETGLNGGEGRTVRNRNSVEEDDDVWFDKESLFRHHLKEVFEKWPYIDDEIWSKVICMEKNRRVAKAYARVPKITINGSDEGFDGQRIGLSGFDNAKRNPDTERIKQHIGQGIQLKMDNAGNILVKCASSAPVYVYTTSGNFQEDSCLSDELIRSEGELDSDLPMKVFDVLRFKKNIDKEMKRSYPDRRKLELQCFTSIVFGEQIGDGGHLDFSCWIMLINIVALDMLKIDFPSREAPGNRGIAPIRPNRPSANDTGSKRYLSTPRDEHYPRLLQQHSMADLSLLESNEYGNDDFDDRASISTYNYVPAYRGHGNMTPMLTSDYADLHLISPQQRRDQLYRSLEQQQYGQDPYYGVDLQYGGMGPGSSTASMVGNAGGTSAYGRSATPLGLSHHALTEPNFKLRDSISGISGRNFTAPSLQRFGVHSRHSRSYDSGLEADVSSISDDAADYGRWTSYQRAQQALPHRQVQHLQQLHRLPPQEWE
ncbi:hypothetical protein BV898_11866 [Hypsibius exemplaris]|uniref:MH2 domain-containing protein n=1 Tax=Hypsibius exemplaris TaxID=2072580 RepID=A0A1W0WF81_HYPEX|nr:hypothetical protein BV898_11866 [Hypsibius exemplaris]